MNGLLSLLIFLPVVGHARRCSSSRGRRRRRSCGSRRLFAGAEFPLSLPLWTSTGFRRSGRLLLPRDARLDPVARREVLARRRRHRGAPDPPDDAPLLHLGLLVVHGDHEAREGVLRVPPPPRDGDGRRLLRARLLPLLRLLGSHARADVLPDRHLGRPAEALRRDQVLPVHARGLGRHAARDHRASTSSTRPASSGGRASGTRRRSTSSTSTTIASSIPPDLQLWLFWAFFLGFAIKVPMFPFHTWLPDAHVEAPTAGSVILAGVLLKMGTYGFLRFSLPICPDASLDARSGSRRGGRRPLDRRHRLRLDGRDGPEGHEEARRVLVGRAPRLRHARLLRAEQRGHPGRDPPVDQPRPLDGRALPSRRHRLRAAAHPHDRGLRRPLGRHAGLRDALHDHPPRLDRPAAPERVRRRVHDPARGPSSRTGGGPRGRASASSSAPPTCSGSTSASSSARSRTRRTRASRT